MLIIKFKIRFFIVLSLILIFLTFLVLINKLKGVPYFLIIIGSLTILLMNVFQPIVKFVYSKILKNNKKDVKGNSFLYSLVAAILVILIVYMLNQNFNWFKTYLDNGTVWGINTAILMINIAILEIKNNNIIEEEKHEKDVKRAKMTIEALEKAEKQNENLRKENESLKQGIKKDS